MSSSRLPWKMCGALLVCYAGAWDAGFDIRPRVTILEFNSNWKRSCEKSFAYADTSLCSCIKPNYMCLRSKFSYISFTNRIFVNESLFRWKTPKKAMFESKYLNINSKSLDFLKSQSFSIHIKWINCRIKQRKWGLVNIKFLILNVSSIRLDIYWRVAASFPWHRDSTRFTPFKRRLVPISIEWFQEGPYHLDWKWCVGNRGDILVLYPSRVPPAIIS